MKSRGRAKGGRVISGVLGRFDSWLDKIAFMVGSEKLGWTLGPESSGGRVLYED